MTPIRLMWACSPLRQSAQVIMTGIDFAPGIDDPDQRYSKIRVLKTHSPVKDPWISSIYSFEDAVLCHCHDPVHRPVVLKVSAYDLVISSEIKVSPL